MKEILIDKEIGGWFGITAKEIREQFESAGSEDIKLVVDCPGGDCFEGISIYNFIRDFCRNNTNRITTYVQGMACSAASWIVCAANSIDSENKIVVEDNSIFMIHNCWGVAIGDHREMEKSANFSKKIDSLIIQMLSNRCKKSTKDISKLMDAETWYFGDEIFENGFCDEVLKVKFEDSVFGGKNEYMDSAKVSFMNCQRKIKEEVEKNPKAYKDCFENSYNIFNSFCTKSDFSDSNKILSEKSESKESKMTLEDLKTKEPNLLNSIMSESAENAITQERNRIESLLNKFEKAGNANEALAFIRNGKTVADDEVTEKLIETAQNSKAMKDRVEDEPPAFNPPATKQDNEDEATKIFNKAFGL